VPQKHYQKMFRTVVSAALLLLILPESSANVVNQLKELRSRYLALEMIENRCPLQKAAYVVAERETFGVASMMDFHHINRHLLDVDEASIELEAASMQTMFQAWSDMYSVNGVMQRTLLNDGQDLLSMDKDEFRLFCCEEAITLVDRYCRGSSDDLGPGVLMPWLNGLECVHMANAGK